MLVTAAKANDAASILGVKLDGLTPECLSKAYRNKAKECHPDKHGSAQLQLWSRVSWANECLKHWLTSQAKTVVAEVNALTGNCRACKGSGRVAVQRSVGFTNPLTMMCVLCKGTGSISEEREPNGGE